MSIADNLALVREKVERAAAASGRESNEILLLAVSKTVPVEVVAEAVRAGQLLFGENRVQEARPKIEMLRGHSLEWHLIGHLQSNKARMAASLFHTVQSVDTVRLALILSESAAASGKRLPVLLQVDLGNEPTKHGIAEDGLETAVEQISALPGLQLDGLMTIPPFFDDPEDARPFFARLQYWRERLEAESPGCLGRRHLSMGMSHDFEVAIQEGSTIVRVGTAIFGERPRA